MAEGRIWHGGDLGEARRLFPGAPEPWIDLSTGVNPVPYPLPELTPDLFARLPAPADLADLERAAADAYGAADAAAVVAAPGTQVLIGLLPRLRALCRVAVVGPTYAEHAAAWRRAGHDVAEVPRLAEAGGADVVVLANPNNPDGRIVARTALLDLAHALRARGGWLVVDEAFADFDGADSLAPVLPAGGVVLRSFGKTYGLAGVRLGFALADPAPARILREALGPWAVSGPALAVGRQALRDRRWREEAAKARRADAGRLDRLLEAAVGAASTGTTLYRLIRSPQAPLLFDRLGRRGVWTRRFQAEPHWLRLGLPASEEAWIRLERALSSD